MDCICSNVHFCCPRFLGSANHYIYMNVKIVTGDKIYAFKRVWCNFVAPIFRWLTLVSLEACTCLLPTMHCAGINYLPVSVARPEAVTRFPCFSWGTFPSLKKPRKYGCHCSFFVFWGVGDILEPKGSLYQHLLLVHSPY
jgi:hypothetical protein